MLDPCGRAVSIYLFVDANHADNVVTRRLHTGVIMFIQNAPTIWFSKIQNTAKVVNFGGKIVALRICTGLIVVFRYKLQMFGVKLEGPKNDFCDNHGVLKKMTILESVLHKK